MASALSHGRALCTLDSLLDGSQTILFGFIERPLSKVTGFVHWIARLVDVKHLLCTCSGRGYVHWRGRLVEVKRLLRICSKRVIKWKRLCTLDSAPDGSQTAFFDL